MIEKRTDFEQKQGAYRQAQKALNAADKAMRESRDPAARLTLNNTLMAAQRAYDSANGELQLAKQIFEALRTQQQEDARIRNAEIMAAADEERAGREAEMNTAMNAW